MRVHRPLPRTVLGMLVAASLVVAPAGARAAPLQCQAQVVSASGTVPLTVRFQALRAGGVLPHEAQWDFGDGTSSASSDPVHVYTTTGFFSAVLTVEDSGTPGEVCRDTVLVLVNAFIDPLCIAQATTRWGDAPLAVNLSAHPGLVFDPEPYTWSWRFGDGDASATQFPDHTFAAPGTYWAVATLHTPIRSYDCYPTLRISSLQPQVAEAPRPAAAELRLSPPRPTPFRVMTLIEFELPRPGRARLAVYDVGGRHVATLVDDHRAAGRQVGVWRGRSDAGSRVEPGLYIARLEFEGAERIVRVIRLP